MTGVKATATALAFVAFLAVSAAEAKRRVNASELGAAWPLTVREAEIDCLRGGEQPGLRRIDAAIVTVNGATYALNGGALNRGYPRPEPVWKTDPRTPHVRVNIGPADRPRLEGVSVT